MKIVSAKAFWGIGLFGATVVAMLGFQNCSGEFKVLEASSNGTASFGEDPLAGSKTCLHPDTREAVPAGSTYSSVARQTGTPGECEAATVRSTCFGSTGLYSPAIPAVKFSKCDPGKLVQNLHAGCLLKSGALQCWGLAGYTDIQGAAPMVPGANSRVVIASGVTDVSAHGQFGVCAVVNGAVRCWGNGQGVNGLQNMDRIMIPSGAVQISAGYFNVCARMTDGTTLCRITAPTATNERTLTGWPITDVLSTDWLYSICGLRSGGILECLPRQYAPPVAPVVKLSGVTQAETVGFGLNSHRTCGLVGSVLKCFGVGIPLPDGSSVDSETPIDVATNVVRFSLAAPNISVALPSGFRSSICVVTTTSSVECWGWYEANRAIPRQVAVASGAYDVKVDDYMRIAVWMKDGSIKTNLANDFGVTSSFVLQDVRLAQ